MNDGFKGLAVEVIKCAIADYLDGETNENYLEAEEFLFGESLVVWAKVIGFEADKIREKINDRQSKVRKEEPQERDGVRAEDSEGDDEADWE